MEFNSPKYHKEIVEDLMNGKFILSKEIYFEELKEQSDYYKAFFKKSFGHDFIFVEDLAYIISSETNENLSRDICIFFAILCYELDKEGVNYLDKIEYGDFTLDDVDRLFENSSFSDLIQNNNQVKDYESRRKLIKTMTAKNIIEKISEDRFLFTVAHRVFIDFAKELGESRSLSNDQKDVNM